MRNNLFCCFLIILMSYTTHAQDIDWVQKLGDIRYDRGLDIVVDEAGNSYITGAIQDETIFGGDTTITTNILLAKYNSNGIKTWQKSFGGSDHDIGNSISVDAAGNSYVTGAFNERIGLNGDTLTSWTGTDILTAKFDANGNPQWMRQIASRSGAEGIAIVHDNAGNSYVASSFHGDLAFDIDEAKLSNDSLTFNNTVYIAPFNDRIIGDDTISVFNDTLVFNGDTASITSNAEFRLYSNLITSNGGLDILLSKYNDNGDLLWNKNIGGSKPDVLENMILGENGELYVTGYFNEQTQLGDIKLTGSGDNDVFIAQLDEDGNVLWAKSAGGDFDEASLDIAADASGNLYITGHFFGQANFGNEAIVSTGNNDIFIAKYNADGSFAWTKKAGGIGDDSGRGIGVDKDGNVYITGVFEDTASFDGWQVVSRGDKDVFAAQYGQDGTVQWVTQFGSTSFDSGNALEVDATGNLYLLGSFANTLNIGGQSVNSTGNFDVFLTRINANIIASTFGENNIENQSEVSIYPNPVKDQLNILIDDNFWKSEFVSLNISNLAGQIIFSKKMNINTPQHSIELGDLPKGMYFLQLFSNQQEQLFTQKLMVK